MRSIVIQKALSIFLIGLFLVPAYAADLKVKDFRSMNQKAALVGFYSENVDETTEAKLTQEFRKAINKYTKTYGASSVAVFNLPKNEGKRFFIPASKSFDENQKKFLTAVGKDNSVDIIVLGSLKKPAEEVEAELQLYDVRIDTASAVEKAQFTVNDSTKGIDALVFRLMNYMDRDGYVHTSSQDFLEAPSVSDTLIAKPAPKNEFSINPSDLSGGMLAGDVSIGGEKTPFWETWWFYALLGGGLLTAGSLTYYFTVVDQPPKHANVGFQLP
jgi:hypothetical protein